MVPISHSGGTLVIRSNSLSRTAAGLCCAALLSFGATAPETGRAALKSAGPLAFAPDGVLLVGDSAAASVFALETGDRAPAKSTSSLEVQGINDKIAAMLGTAPDQIAINDVAVNPLSKNVYLSVSRGRGPQAVPLILRVDAAGKISELSLDNIKHSSVHFPDPPTVAGDTPRAQSQRMDTITSLAYTNGRVFVAGLSNEEFSSSLRSIPYPFQDAGKATGIEIYHGSHGRFETAAPVRTFVP